MSEPKKLSSEALAEIEKYQPIACIPALLSHIAALEGENREIKDCDKCDLCEDHHGGDK